MDVNQVLTSFVDGLPDVLKFSPSKRGSDCEMCGDSFLVARVSGSARAKADVFPADDGDGGPSLQPASVPTTPGVDSWRDRNEVVTKDEHEEHVILATELINHLLENLAIDGTNSNPESTSPECGSFHTARDDSGGTEDRSVRIGDPSFCESGSGDESNFSALDASFDARELVSNQSEHSDALEAECSHSDTLKATPGVPSNRDSAENNFLYSDAYLTKTYGVDPSTLPVLVRDVTRKALGQIISYDTSSEGESSGSSVQSLPSPEVSPLPIPQPATKDRAQDVCCSLPLPLAVDDASLVTSCEAESPINVHSRSYSPADEELFELFKNLNLQSPACSPHVDFHVDCPPIRRRQFLDRSPDNLVQPPSPPKATASIGQLPPTPKGLLDFEYPAEFLYETGNLNASLPHQEHIFHPEHVFELPLAITESIGVSVASTTPESPAETAPSPSFNNLQLYSVEPLGSELQPSPANGTTITEVPHTATDVTLSCEQPLATSHLNCPIQSSATTDPECLAQQDLDVIATEPLKDSEYLLDPELLEVTTATDITISYEQPLATSHLDCPIRPLATTDTECLAQQDIDVIATEPLKDSEYLLDPEILEATVLDPRKELPPSVDECSVQPLTPLKTESIFETNLETSSQVGVLEPPYPPSVDTSPQDVNLVCHAQTSDVQASSQETVPLCGSNCFTESSVVAADSESCLGTGNTSNPEPLTISTNSVLTLESPLRTNPEYLQVDLEASLIKPESLLEFGVLLEDPASLPGTPHDGKCPWKVDSPNNLYLVGEPILEIDDPEPSIELLPSSLAVLESAPKIGELESEIFSDYDSAALNTTFSLDSERPTDSLPKSDAGSPFEVITANSSDFPVDTPSESPSNSPFETIAESACNSSAEFSSDPSVTDAVNCSGSLAVDNSKLPFEQPVTKLPAKLFGDDTRDLQTTILLESDAGVVADDHGHVSYCEAIPNLLAEESNGSGLTPKAAAVEYLSKKFCPFSPLPGDIEPEPTSTTTASGDTDSRVEHLVAAAQPITSKESPITNSAVVAGDPDCGDGRQTYFLENNLISAVDCDSAPANISTKESLGESFVASGGLASSVSDRAEPFSASPGPSRDGFIAPLPVLPGDFDFDFESVLESEASNIVELLNQTPTTADGEETASIPMPSSVEPAPLGVTAMADTDNNETEATDKSGIELLDVNVNRLDAGLGLNPIQAASALANLSAKNSGSPTPKLELPTPQDATFQCGSASPLPMDISGGSLLGANQEDAIRRRQSPDAVGDAQEGADGPIQPCLLESNISEDSGIDDQHGAAQKCKPEDVASGGLPTSIRADFPVDGVVSGNEIAPAPTNRSSETRQMTNYSEAGPEVADLGQEFTPANEFFMDPSSMDFLEKCNVGTFTESSLARMSLYLKFDPLAPGNSPMSRRLTMWIKQQQQLGNQEQKPKNDTPVLPDSENSSPPKGLSGGQGKNASRLIDLGDSPMNIKSVSKRKGTDSSRETAAPTPAPSSESKTLSDDEVRQMLKIQELLFQDRLLMKDRDWDEKVKQLEAEKKELGALLQKHRESELQMRKIVDEYEKTITQLIRDRERDKQLLTESNVQATRERDQALEDFQNVETAFSDLYRRYEKAKGALEGFKKNEETLKAHIAEYQVRLKKQVDNFNMLKSNAEETLESANLEIENLRKSNTSEVAALRAQLKKAEMKVDGLKRGLEQKAKENDELTNICDELIAKVGHGGTQ